jgi:hypothetical protein
MIFFNCLQAGIRYGNLQLRTALTFILRNFTVSTTKKLEDVKATHGVALVLQGIEISLKRVA